MYIHTSYCLIEAVLIICMVVLTPGKPHEMSEIFFMKQSFILNTWD